MEGGQDREWTVRAAALGPRRMQSCRRLDELLDATPPAGCRGSRTHCGGAIKKFQKTFSDRNVRYIGSRCDCHLKAAPMGKGEWIGIGVAVGLLVLYFGLWLFIVRR